MVKEQGKCLIAAWFLFILYFSAVTPRACFQRPYIFFRSYSIEVLSFVSPSTPFIFFTVFLKFYKLQTPNTSFPHADVMYYCKQGCSGKIRGG